MKILINAIAVLSVVFSITAVAGFNKSEPVVVDLTEFKASGDMWSARTAANGLDFIGCGREVNLDLGWDQGFCQAQDADGNFIGCLALDPALVKVIDTITPYSYIRFTTDGVEPGFLFPGWHICTQIYVSTNSFYLPQAETAKKKVSRLRLPDHTKPLRNAPFGELFLLISDVM